MFDIGFWELMLIGIMGLIVLGPERLPVAIRTVRGWITGVRNFSDNVKSELTEELRIHELHANLKKAEQGGMKNLSPEIAESVKSLQEAAEMVREPFKNMDTKSIDDNNIPSSTSNQSPLVESNDENSSQNDESESYKVNNVPTIDKDKKE
jgi:sec-independent protein translocase protein TatB